MNLTNWEHPGVLYWLWGFLPVAWLLYRAHRKRLAAARQFADPAMVRRLMPPLTGPRPWIKGSLLLLGLAFVIVAMTRPRFGVQYETVSQRGLDLFVALDVSRSMTAKDVAPNRLDRAKLDIRDLLNRLGGDRVGLVVFAGKSVVKAPLTSDYGFFRLVLDQIDTTSAPRGGTLIGDAIRKAVDAMPEKTDRDRVILLITDGQDQDSYPKEAAERAADEGITIFTVGLGDSEQGAEVPDVQYDGKPVRSRLDERLLKEVALATGGAYIPAGTRAYDLGQIYEDYLAELTRGELAPEKRKRFKERFQPFLALGIVLLLIELSIPSYPRRSRTQRQSSGSQAASRAAMILVLVVGSPVAASAGSPEEDVARGIKHFNSGDFKTALSAFRDAEVARPEDPWVQYDVATAYAAGGDSEKAEPLYQDAASRRDQDLVIRCRYNLGNLAAQQARTLFGQKPEEAAPEVRAEGLALLTEAVAHYRNCLQMDKSHADSRHNLEVIRLWIKHVQALWAQRDRQKQRDEMSLLEFLAMLEAHQRELRSAAQSMAVQPDSPRRRQAVSTGAAEQRNLREEIEPLKGKIAGELQPPAQPSGTTPAPAPPAADVQRAIDVLNKLADEAGDAMLAAADRLDQRSVEDAIEDQTEAVEKLDEIYMGVAPFPTLLERAIGTQQGLVDQVTEVVRPSGNEHDADEGADQERQEPHLTETAWNQDFVARWAQIMGPKAQQGLAQLGEMGEGGVGSEDDASANDAEAIRKQMQGLKQSMQKAVELAPKAAQSAGQAADRLEEEKPQEALPEQEEALRLLEEIAESLPKQDQQQDERQQENQQQAEDQQQQQEQSGQDPQQQPQPERRRQDLSRQQAEAVLRKLRERQRERRELEKQLQQYLARPGAVEKDW